MILRSDLELLHLAGDGHRARVTQDAHRLLAAESVFPPKFLVLEEPPSQGFTGSRDQQVGLLVDLQWFSFDGLTRQERPTT